MVEPSEIKFDAVEGQNSGAKVAGLIGFAAGCGALLAGPLHHLTGSDEDR